MEKESGIIELIGATEKELLKLSYRPSTVKQYQRVWRQFKKYSRQCGEVQFSEGFGTKFLKDVYGWPDDAGTGTPYMRHAARAMRLLGEYRMHGIVLSRKRIFYRGWEKDFGETLNGFKQYGSAKGMSASSIFRIEQVLGKLFEYMQAQGIYSCDLMDAQSIDGFVKTLAGFAPKTVNVSLFALRAFLDYLYENEITEKNLRAVVPSAKGVKRRTVPSTWTSEESERIINAVDTSNPAGKRDFAILLMIARLGMRQSDVVNLKLENIDWTNCTISFVQAKTKKTLALPLAADVGNAVIEYLKHGRPPAESKYVFVKHIPPFDPLKEVYMILDKHLRHAGISMAPGRQKGAHTLRHSLASRLLENETSIEMIAAILGHTGLGATLDYLKIDIKALSECALDPEEVMENAWK
jgi:site-specific recombinase XerD